MGNYEQKPGQVTIWENDAYEKGGNKPYAKGKGLDLNGKECEFTLWIPKSDKIKGFNLTISEPYQKPQNEQPAQKPQQTEQFEQDDSGLPF